VVHDENRSAPAPPGRWRRRCLLAAGVLALLGGVMLGILRFGNPQWHPAIYIFQAYHWPGDERGMTAPPEGDE
jgi:hypothetical protein